MQILVTARQAAEQVWKKPSTIRGWVHQGLLEPVRILSDNTYLYDLAQVFACERRLRYRKGGRPFKGTPSPEPAVHPLREKPQHDMSDAFWSQVEQQVDGCWLWTGTIDAQGYGDWTDRKTTSPHRWSYELHHGEIPKGQQIDHLCHNRDLTCVGGVTCQHRACVNPDHLEAVPRRVNQQRVHQRHREMAAALAGFGVSESA